MLTKLLLTVAIVGTAASVAGLGTFATFTSTVNVDQAAVQSGTVQIAVGAAGTSANRLTIGASGVLPGDSLQRAIDLTNSGDSDLASVTLTTTATTSSVLDSDGTNGLQMVIDSCSNPWTETAAGSGYTYSCGATTQSVLASTPVIGSNLALANLSSLTAGGLDHLRVTLTLPASADNSFQGKTSNIRYTFDATQRNATAK